MSRTMTLDLLRHGACEGGEIFRGSTDVALSERGWRQLRSQTAEHAGWQRILSSPLQRCHRFAEELRDRFDLPLQVEADLRELSFGDWEGQPIAEVHAEQPERAAALWRDPERFCAPNGESVQELDRRLGQLWQRLLQEHGDEHLLLVSHGGALRVLLMQILGMPLAAMSSLHLGYAAMVRVSVYQEAGHRPFAQLQWLRQSEVA